MIWNEAVWAKQTNVNLFQKHINIPRILTQDAIKIMTINLLKTKEDIIENELDFKPNLETHLFMLSN